MKQKRMSSTQELAYYLWQARGCPEGSPDVDWHKAELITQSKSKVVKSQAKVHPKQDSPKSKPNTPKQDSPKSNTAKQPSKQPPSKQQECSNTLNAPTENQQTKGVSEKQKALSFKEGAKKGQDLSGLEDMGGVHFFHVALETCDGEWELVEKAMEGANTPVDDKAEERKGGAENIGKAFFSASAERLCIYIHVPEKLTSEVSIEEWLNVLTSSAYAKVIQEPCRSPNEGGGLFAKAEVVKPPYQPLNDISAAVAPFEVFPLKLRDTAIGAGFAFLRKKGLVPEDDDSSELEIEDGYEW